MSIYDEMDIPANWYEMDVHDKMAHIAEMETHAPYDIMRDVWDIAEDSRIGRETFDMLLKMAIETFLAYDSMEAYCKERYERY